MQFKSETDPTDLNDSATFSRQKMSPRKCAQELNEHLKKKSLWLFHNIFHQQVNDLDFLTLKDEFWSLKIPSHVHQ